MDHCLTGWMFEAANIWPSHVDAEKTREKKMSKNEMKKIKLNSLLTQQLN